MPCTLHNADSPDIISVSNMPDGALGVLVECATCPDSVGQIVQRYGSALVVLGERSGRCWGTICENTAVKSPFRVRLLKPGELIRVGEVE